MKKTFTKNYILGNRGCYLKEDVEQIKCINNKTITLKQLFRDLPIKDFTWFLAQKCDLTLRQKRFFALECAKHVLPIYEKHSPEDNRVKECIEEAELYLNGNSSIEKLIEKRYAAADVAAAAYTTYITYAASAAYTAADVADVAYTAYAAYTASAASAASAATDAAYTTYAAYTASAATDASAAYRQFIWSYVEKLK